MSLFELPTFEQLTHQLEKVLEALRWEKMGTYFVHCKASTATPTSSLHFEKKDRFTDQTRNVTVPLIVSQPKKEGTLVTIIRAAIGLLRDLQNELFDEEFKKRGFEFELPCQLQNHKGSQILNGNRFVVIVGVGQKDIPNEIKVTDPQTNEQHSFYTSYKGKTYHCRRCNTDHAGTCLQMQNFFKLKDQRAGKTIKFGIVSDSTLRHVEEVGLNAHVACVSGGLLGDVVTAAADLKTRTENLIIMAGQNNIEDKRHQYRNDTEFRFAIERGLVKTDEIFNHRKIESLSIFSM